VLPLESLSVVLKAEKKEEIATLSFNKALLIKKWVI
jgi:hypothetical protein